MKYVFYLSDKEIRRIAEEDLPVIPTKDDFVRFNDVDKGDVVKVTIDYQKNETTIYLE